MDSEDSRIISRDMKEPRLNIANVLCYNGKYDVYLLVVKFEGNVISKKPLEDVHLIEVAYIEDKEYSQVLNKGGIEMNWTVEDKKDDDHLIKLLGFYMYFTYKGLSSVVKINRSEPELSLEKIRAGAKKRQIQLVTVLAIIENPKVEIYGIPQRIFDWLKLMGQQFALGIAEFSLSGGAFPLFEEIGLKKYIAATSTIPFPIYLHFFGQELYYLMPELKHPQVYYTFYEQNQVEYLNLARKRALEKNLLGNHKLIKVEEMPKMWDLLRKSKYYLINVHPLGQFPFPNIPKRIVNIGGIEVEIEGILNEIEEEMRLKEEKKNKGSITGFIKNKVKEFIEDPVFEWIKKALYVGVPLILIPFTFKQKFNAKIAEYMKVGITVDHTKFVEEFPLAVKKLMSNTVVNYD
uniref:glucuronosyltransferase n=1 Tax=Meloidogyne javanica TaxID=6303 RepID=A0A915MCR0_MELJA